MLRSFVLQFEEQATKDDLMGIEDTGHKGLFHKSSLKQKNTVFTIGNRGDVLTTHLEADIIIPHSAHKNETRVSYFITLPLSAGVVVLSRPSCV